MNTCHLAILFDSKGFSMIYLIVSNFVISQELWYNMYCLSFLAVQARAQQNFSHDDYFESYYVNFLLR